MASRVPAEQHPRSHRCPRPGGRTPSATSLRIQEAAIRLWADEPEPRASPRSRPRQESGARRSTATSRRASRCSRRSARRASPTASTPRADCRLDEGTATEALGRLLAAHGSSSATATASWSSTPPARTRSRPARARSASRRRSSSWSSAGQAEGEFSTAIPPHWGASAVGALLVAMIVAVGEGRIAARGRARPPDRDGRRRPAPAVIAPAAGAVLTSVRAVVVLFNRDLRVHDHPALSAAARGAEHVVPRSCGTTRCCARASPRPNRLRFLLDSLADLDGALRARGAGLVVRRGDVVRETIALAREAGAEAVFTERRRERLRPRAPRAARASMRGAAHRAAHLPRRDDRAARRPRAGRRRPLPGLHPLLAPLARGAAARGARRAAQARRSRRGLAARAPAHAARADARATVARRCPRAARRRAASASRRGSAPAWRATASATTTSPATRPRASARTCASAACRRARCSSACATGPAPSRSCASSAGATSTSR